MTFFYKASGFFVSFLICALLFWSCKSTNELSSQYLLYDKDLSPAHISAEYCWLGDGTAQLHFTCDSIPSSVMIHDSVSAAISVSQDSIGRALVQHERFVFDSTLQGTVTLHSIDSTKCLHSNIVLQSLFL